MRSQSSCLSDSRSANTKTSLRYVLFVITCLISLSTYADFYVWTNSHGQRQVSNVPHSGFTEAGRLKQAYDPNSIVYQHAQMLEAIAVQGEEIALQLDLGSEALDRDTFAESIIRPVRAAPREGLMSLDELIELEKRGGRYYETPPNAP